MKTSKLGYRDLVRVLILEIRILHDLFKDANKYKKFLEVLANYEEEHDDPPYQKDLIETLGMTRTKLMNLMQNLYEDFQKKLFNPKAYPLYSTEIWLSVRARDDYWLIGIESLDFLPKKGEYFTIKFVRGEIGGRHFRVEDIRHELGNGIHRIDISLSDYWEYDGEFYPDV